MSSDLLEEIREAERQVGMAKHKLMEVKTKGTDQLQSYARDMPPELADAGDWWFDILVMGVEDPACPELVVAAVLGIYGLEGVMSRWLAQAEVLFDKDRERDYKAISTGDPRLRNIFTNVDFSDAKAENEEEAPKDGE